MSRRPQAEWKTSFVSRTPAPPAAWPQLSTDKGLMPRVAGMHAWVPTHSHTHTPTSPVQPAPKLYFCFHGLNATSLYMQRSSRLGAVGRLPNCSRCAYETLYSYKI